MENKQNIDELTKKKIDVLLVEYNALREELRLIMNANTKDLQLVLVIVAGLLALSSKQNALVSTSVVIALIPMVIFVFGIIYFHKQLFWGFLARHLSDIELEINFILNTQLMRWESKVFPEYVMTSKLYKIIIFSLAICIGLLWVLCIFYVIYSFIVNGIPETFPFCLSPNSTIAIAAYLIINIIMGVVIGVLFKGWLNLDKRRYEHRIKKN